MGAAGVTLFQVVSRWRDRDGRGRWRRSEPLPPGRVEEEYAAQVAMIGRMGGSVVLYRLVPVEVRRMESAGE